MSIFMACPSLRALLMSRTYCCPLASSVQWRWSSSGGGPTPTQTPTPRAVPKATNPPPPLPPSGPRIQWPKKFDQIIPFLWQVFDMAKEDMKHIKGAPTPALGAAALASLPLLTPPLAMAAQGFYSTGVATAHLSWAAGMLAFHSGTHVGMSLLKGGDIDWNFLSTVWIPAWIGWGAVQLGNTSLILSGLMLTGGTIGSLVLDLNSTALPPWYRGIRCAHVAVLLGSILGLFFFKMVLPGHMCNKMHALPNSNTSNK